MAKDETKSSVHDEQFGSSENMDKEGSESVTHVEENDPQEVEQKEKKKTKSKSTAKTSAKKTKKNDLKEGEKKSTGAKKTKKTELKPDDPVTEIETFAESVHAESGIDDGKEAEADNEMAPGELVSGENEIRSSDEASSDEVTSAEEISPGEATSPKYFPEQIDYSKLSKEDLVKVLKDLVNSGQINDLRKDVEAIKSSFYKKHKAEIEEIRTKFLESGGLPQDFKIEESPVETELKELLNRYRDLKNESSKKQDEEKDSNLEGKYRIIESIKELVNSQESLNKTFQEFRELQNRWRETGPVPQANLKDLWESYHYHVEAFYDYIKINKELRDLDLKKNLELKIKLCESAEELMLEPSVVEAFRRLQKLHDQWREIGPVPIEKRNEIWERFKEATSKINRKHQEYFVNLKQEQKKNYEEKLLLCEKAESILNENIENHTDWEKKSHELIELQRIWKTIGFAPRKYNSQIYERFRKACDAFFDKKREFYSQNREEQQNNLQLKTELCIQAEALQNSTDWKKTTDELITLQKRWKEIGPVPAKQSDKIWKRFRAACDTFFNNKSKFFSNIDTQYEENLEKKLKLIEKIENFEITSDAEKDLKELKDLQREWSEIGFVPLKSKVEIQDRYRKAINEKFDQLRLDENKKALLKFRSRLENIVSKPNTQQRLRMERDKLFNRLKQLENDIALWENNIGFFATSENADSMIIDINRKIESAKSKIDQIKGKIKMLDDYED